MAAGFGTGLALQGQPALHGQYFNQRQAAEEAKRQGVIDRDDDLYKQELKRVNLPPESVDWKLQPLARKAVADYAYQVTKMRKENPLTWENDVAEFRQQATQDLADIQSSSAAMKELRKAVADKKVHVSPGLQRWMDTGQGDLESNLPSPAEQALYGIIIDPKTHHVAARPVSKVNIQEEVRKNILSQKDAFQDEIDPKTGQPKIYTYNPPGGAIEYQSRRKLTPGMVASTYQGMLTNQDFAQNINLAFYEKIKKEPGFTEEMVLNPDRTFNEKFIEGAENYGLDIAQEEAKNYFTPNQISQPHVTNIKNLINTGDTKMGALTPVVKGAINLGMLTGRLVDSDNDPATPAVPGKDVFDVNTEAQFTTAPFKGHIANSPTTKDIQTGKPVDEPGVDDAEYSSFAVVPVYNDKVKKELQGIIIPGNAKNSRTQQNYLQSMIDQGKVEWKVVGIGKYTQGEGKKAKDKSVYRDAEELIGAAALPLSEPDTQRFSTYMQELQETARKLQAGEMKPTIVPIKPEFIAKPPAVAPSNSRINDRKGKVSEKGKTTTGKDDVL